MRRAMVVGAVVLVAGCGGDGGEAEPDGRKEGPAAGSEPAEQATTQPDSPAAARSDGECVELWNAGVKPGTAGQTSPGDYVMDIAAKGRVRGLVRYVRGDCVLVVPFRPGAKRGYGFVALKGRAPFNLPAGALPIPPGVEQAFNVRVNRDGTLALRR